MSPSNHGCNTEAQVMQLHSHWQYILVLKRCFSCFMHRLDVCDTGSTACGRHAGKTLRNTSYSGHGLECYLFMAGALCLFFSPYVTIEDFIPFCLSKNPGF